MSTNYQQKRTWFKSHRNEMRLFVGTFVIAFSLVAFSKLWLIPPPPNRRTVMVYIAAGKDAVFRKQVQSMSHIEPTDRVELRTLFLDLEGQRKFVKKHNCGVRRFDEFIQRNQDHLSTELWKYCALSQDVPYDAVYIDRSSPLIVRLQDILEPSGRPSTSAAVMSHEAFPESIHGSLLILKEGHKYVAKEMLQTVVNTPAEVLEASPLVLPRKLFSLVSGNTTVGIKSQKGLLPSKESDSWFLFEQHCEMEPLRRVEGVSYASSTSSSRKVHSCPAEREFCCLVRDGAQQEIVMMNRHPLLPFQKITEKVVLPYNPRAGFYHEDELPYISTIREKVFERPTDWEATPNMYEIFVEKNLIPHRMCNDCMHRRKCELTDMYRFCKKYFKDICSFEAPTKFVSNQLIISPPLYRRDPSRLIPRIIHQTWYEELTKDKYPNMSRLVESFKQSGWEYKFYSDEDAELFLQTHFPPEVLETYQSIIPGAFKADLFRYCALLIHGGVYADVDLLLETNLDLAIEPDIGFVVPHDEPEAMLWQGFIGAAPGHIFLAKAIETYVNQARNRFTSIDMDNKFCPEPKFKLLHMFDVLFTAGPGLMGSAVNRVLGRHAQTPFVPGDLAPVSFNENDFVNIPEGHEDKLIPGRTVILKQNKWDMEAHRFTYVDRNLVVASTDLQDSDDRKNRAPIKAEKTEEEDGKKKEKDGGEHYSKAHAKEGIYGLEGLYVDLSLADEDIKIFIDASRQLSMSSSIDMKD